jgi:hypothetical protein
MNNILKKMLLKIQISCILVVIAANYAKAQVSLYDFTQTTSTYTPITGGSVVATATTVSGAGSLDDINYVLPTATIPFNFNFSGTVYTGYVINTNGYITFGSTSPATNGYLPLSTTTPYNGAVSAMGGDLNAYFISGNTSQTGEIRQQTIGSSPNRIHVIQFRNFRIKSTGTTYGAAMNFQIRLIETTNRIEIAYGFTGTFGTASYQVGLRGANTTYPTNIKNRSITAGSQTWETSINGTTAASTCRLSSILAPASGLTYQFTPTLCSAPINGFAYPVSTTTATLNWTNLGTGGSFKVEYGPVGFAVGTGTVINTTNTSHLISGLNVGTQYSFYVQRLCGGSSGNIILGGPFNFFTGSNGEDCATAINLNVSASCSYTLVNTGLSINGSVSNCSDINGNQVKNDVWYKFTAPNNGSKIVITTQAGTVNDWVMELWSDCPGTSTGAVLKCGDDQNAFMPEIQLCQNEYVGGQVYYIRTWTYNSSLSGNMNLCVFQTTACPLPPANDNCTTATFLGINLPTSCPTYATTYTTVNATSTAEVASCDAASGKRDVWFTFNTGNFGNLQLTISPLTATNLKAQLIFECGGFEMACYSPANGSYTLTGLNPQADYKLRVWTDAAGVGTFRICLADICDDPTANISGSIVMCAGATAPLQVNLTGFSPWTFVYNNGVSNQSVTTSTSPYTLNVNPTVSTSYNLVSVNSLYCAGTVSGTGVVTILPTPVVTLANFSPVCGNVITSLSGGSPAGGTYSGQGVQSGAINGNLAGVGTHIITYTFGQGLGCQRSATKPITVLKAPAITGFAPGTAPVGSNVSISGLDLAEVNSLTFNNLPATQFTVINDFAIQATVPASATSGLIRVTNSFGCTSSTVDPFAVGTPAPGANLALKVFMQGFYAGSNNMLPVTDPFNAPSNVDTISVELRSALAPYGLVTSRKGPINTSGNGLFIFPAIFSGNSYYVVIKHRNSIETWSKQPISLPLGGSNYNFTISGSGQRSLLPNVFNQKEVIPVTE